MNQITIVDLARVVYSSGKVFDGLQTGRLDTYNFLRSGDISGVTSRSDLALLEDLRDMAQFVVEHIGQEVNTDYLVAVNSRLTRSGPIHPGQLRTDSQTIGVSTPFGRHEPPAATLPGLEAMFRRAANTEDAHTAAIKLFVELARAQPFEDGNKRTALFVANGWLLSRETGTLLTVPEDENDPTVARQFTELLAKAYLYGEDDAVVEFMRTHGVKKQADSSEPPTRADGTYTDD